MLESLRYFGDLHGISDHVDAHEENVKFVPQYETGDHVLEQLYAEIIDTKEFEVVKPDDSVLQALPKLYDLVYKAFQLGAIYAVIVKDAPMLVNEGSLKLLQDLTQGALTLIDLRLYGLEPKGKLLIFHHQERLAAHHFYVA